MPFFSICPVHSISVSSSQFFLRACIHYIHLATMFGKLFPSSGASSRSSIPAMPDSSQQDGMLTPKASAQPIPNPFDTFASQPGSISSHTPQRTASQLSLSTLAQGGARTPKSANATPGGSMSYHDGIQPRSSFFGPITPGNVTPGGAAPVTPGGLPTTCECQQIETAEGLPRMRGDTTELDRRRQ